MESCPAFCLHHSTKPALFKTLSPHLTTDVHTLFLPALPIPGCQERHTHMHARVHTHTHADTDTYTPIYPYLSLFPLLTFSLALSQLLLPQWQCFSFSLTPSCSPQPRTQDLVLTPQAFPSPPVIANLVISTTRLYKLSMWNDSHIVVCSTALCLELPRCPSY